MDACRRPEWLVSGDGTGSMELDRWYINAGVAFEFQGPQHYRTGPLAPTEEQLQLRQMRDKQKAVLCNEEGIRLIQIRADDLTFATIRDKVRGHLELIPPRNNRPLHRYINQLCRSYINYASQD